MKKPQFIENEIYHIYNRGVEKRKTFLNKDDYFRFIHDLFEFNNEDPTEIRLFNNTEVEPLYLKKKKPRKLLIEILAFVLMPNHFHLILRQKIDNGIVKFMQKLGTGYAMYFNQKYERVGGLFQGRFKAVIIKDDAHFMHLPFYIHFNPLELYGGSTSVDWKMQMKFIENYRWSSYLDYIGKKNFPSITNRELILNFWGSEKQYYEESKKWLKERIENIEMIKEVVLE